MPIVRRVSDTPTPSTLSLVWRGSGVTSLPVSRPARGSLTREQTVDATIHLVDAHGPSAPSTRRLGYALGVGGMAIYWHFAERGRNCWRSICNGVYENPAARPDEVGRPHAARHGLDTRGRPLVDHPQVFGLASSPCDPRRIARSAWRRSASRCCNAPGSRMNWRSTPSTSVRPRLLVRDGRGAGLLRARPRHKDGAADCVAAACSAQISTSFSPARRRCSPASASRPLSCFQGAFI